MLRRSYLLDYCLAIRTFGLEIHTKNIEFTTQKIYINNT